MSHFSHEEILMLAECERMMDDGRIPFVMLDGQRLCVQPETMQEFQLKQGQTINRAIHCAMLEFTIASLQARIAIDKACESVRSERQ